jgi:MFS family permease
LALRLPAALLLLSGGAALVYQVLWIKQLSLVVGVEVHAVTTGISAFFAGLALGGWLFGRWADQLARPVRCMRCWRWRWRCWGGQHARPGGVGRVVRPDGGQCRPAGLVAAVCPGGGPALLMGGTLPVLVRALAPAPGQQAQASGRLYAANTAGAIAGTLLRLCAAAAPRGDRQSLAAASMNLLAGLGAWILRRNDQLPRCAQAN